MYNSKALLPARGRLRVKVLFERKNGLTDIEIGFSQSVNVARHYEQMFEEAILNAFYKLNHRTGENVFNKNNYAEDINEYINQATILSHGFNYYEDRIYQYKRRSVKGKYRYIITRKGKYYKQVKPKYVKQKEQDKIQDNL